MDMTTNARPSRRALARGVAWSAPTIVIAAAAPAYAASPQVCAPQTFSWASVRDASTGKVVSGSKATVGRTTVTVTAPGVSGATNNSQNLTVGSMGGIADSLILYSPNQTAPASTNQTVTLDFSAPVSNVKLTLSDVDRLEGKYEDRVSLSPTGFAATGITNGTTGSGTSASPFVGGTESADAASGANINLAWSSSLSRLSITYGQGITVDGQYIPHIGISAVTFTPSVC